MNECLAIHAEHLALAAFGFETVAVLDVIVDAIDTGQREGPRRQHALRQCRHQREALLAGTHAAFLDEVIGADDQAGEPVFRSGPADLGQVEDGERRLDHRPQCRTLRQGRGPREVCQACNLGHQDGVCPRLPRHGEIVLDPGRLQPVDADDGAAAPETAGFHGRGNEVSGLGFLLRGNGVFEIEDERVGRQRPGFFQDARLVAGHVEHGTEGFECHGATLASALRPVKPTFAGTHAATPS